MSDGQLITRAASAADDAALRALVAVPMTTRGVLLSFQREPSYFAASQVVYSQQDQAVVEHVQTGEIVALYSNGYRPCYVNGAVQNLRYACDLRVKPTMRGKEILVNHLSPRFRATMLEPDYSQMIIFNDNHAARAAIQNSKLGMPHYYDEGLIETLTLTGFKARRMAQNTIAAQAAQSGYLQDLSEIACRTAQASDVEAMNAFIASMAQHYNFIPAYDFQELLAGHAYFQGLSIGDFQLYEQHGQLVGLYALWKQSAFKQSKIVDYGMMIGLARPIYNLWAKWVGAMKLPAKGESFQYHALHSLLCHPQHLALHDQMLQDAFMRSKQQGVGCINYTLSHQDPRYQLNRCYKGEVLTGMHGFVSYNDNPLLQMDRQRIPYLEVGRI